MSNVGFLIGVIVMDFCEIFVFSRFYEKKLNFRSFRLYFLLFLFVFISMFNYSYNNAFLKIIISTLLLGLCNLFVFNERLNKTIISTLYVYLLTTISDIIGALFFVFILGKDTNWIRSDVFGSLVGNVFITLIFVSISYLPFVRKVYLKLVNLTENLKLKNVITLCLLVIISINFLLAFMYYELKSVYVVIINTVLLLIYSYIVYKSLNEKNNSMIVKAENDSLMDSLHQYEDMVDRQRVDNHENKNQLLIIKNMINKKDKDVVKYIDTIIKDQKEDDEALYTRVMTIPSGGLQGIIYSITNCSIFCA